MAEERKGYEEIKEKIMGCTANKVAAKESAVEMSVGNVKADEEDQWPSSWEECEVNMTGRCCGCGGIGHPARLCPSKGRGKGKAAGKSDAGWKGGGKGGGRYTGQGKGPFGGWSKGGGKGYQGDCWKCGKIGHKARECRLGMVEEEGRKEEEEEEDEWKQCSGVWRIGNVGIFTSQIGTSNRFEALGEEEEDDSEASAQYLENADKYPAKKANKSRKQKKAEARRDCNEERSMKVVDNADVTCVDGDPCITQEDTCQCGHLARAGQHCRPTSWPQRNVKEEEGSEGGLADQQRWRGKEECMSLGVPRHGCDQDSRGGGKDLGRRE